MDSNHRHLDVNQGSSPLDHGTIMARRTRASLQSKGVRRSEGAPPMSCDTLFRGWLLLSLPFDFFAPSSLHARRFWAARRAMAAVRFLSYCVCKLCRSGTRASCPSDRGGS